MAETYWTKTSEAKSFPALKKDLEVDVAVVGGGITGITAAYLLKKAGKKVALLERDALLLGDTANTTAHLTYVTDTRLSELVKRFGKDHARAVWDAGRAAIEKISEIVQAEHIECGYRSVPGFLHTSLDREPGSEADGLKEDAELARELGFEAAYIPSIIFLNRDGIRFSKQAKFHPLRYLSSLLSKIEGDGSYVFENTEASEFQKDPFQVQANGHTVRCEYLVIATHVPLMGVSGLPSATLFQTKLAPYSSYAIGASLPKGTLADSLFWDTSDPYYYLRVDRRENDEYAIFGGEDHKTGQEANPGQCFERLETRLMSLFPNATIDARWTGQVVETHDGLPYIGENAERQFIATGFSGNGMTFGTLGGVMAADAVRLGRKNPWTELFDPGRKKLSSAWDYLKENIDYPYYFLRDKIAKAEGESLENLAPGEGKILKIGGDRVAAFRDQDGKVTTVSAVCTHMGCIVHWNKADETWDCPCHGSRFRTSGEVIGGPAETPLEQVNTKG